MKLLLLGATGLVGRHALQLALANPVFSEVIAPTRTALAPAGKLLNPVVEHLEVAIALLTVHTPDVLVCTLGSTQAKAGSQQAFRHVDYELPMAFAKAAHAAGVPVYALVTAMGASAEARSFYYRTKGELETDIAQIGLRSLVICRPSLIAGQRQEHRAAEGAALMLLRWLAPVLPKQFHSNPADRIAAALLDAVIAAKSGVTVIDSRQMR